MNDESRPAAATRLREMIRSQPEALRAVGELDVADAARTVGDGRRVFVVGTGTSFHAAELGADLFRTGGIDAQAVTSVDFVRRRPAVDDAIVLISHTGSTAYARRIRADAQTSGVPLVTITGSAAGWDEAIVTPTQERSDTYTVSYTAALGVLGLIAAGAAGATGATGATDIETGRSALLRVADQIEQLIRQPDLDRFPLPRGAIALVGPGLWGVTAREGALKLRESAHLLAEGFDPERLLHGAAVPYGPDNTLIALQPGADPDGLTAALVDAARSEGLTTVVFDDASVGDPFLAQFVATVRLQLLAAHLTDVRGTDPDTAITGAWAREELWTLGGPVPR